VNHQAIKSRKEPAFINFRTGIGKKSGNSMAAFTLSFCYQSLLSLSALLQGKEKYFCQVI
jgi:hypothetical protein